MRNADIVPLAEPYSQPGETKLHIPEWLAVSEWVNSILVECGHNHSLPQLPHQNMIIATQVSNCTKVCVYSYPYKDIDIS